MVLLKTYSTYSYGDLKRNIEFMSLFSRCLIMRTNSKFQTLLTLTNHNSGLKHRSMENHYIFRKKRFFVVVFLVSQQWKKEESGIKTILKLPDLPIAHFDRCYPNFLGVVSKLTTPQNFGVPDPAKVGRTRFMSAKNNMILGILGILAKIINLTHF